MKLWKYAFCVLSLLLCFSVGFAEGMQGHKLPDSYYSVLGVPIGATEEEVTASLGKPTSYKDFYGIHTLTYGGTIFNFTRAWQDGHHRLAYIILTNRDATIVGNVAVGDPIDVLDTIFDFYPDRAVQSSENPNEVMLFYGQFVPRTDDMYGIWFKVEKNKERKFIIKSIKVGYPR